MKLQTRILQQMNKRRIKFLFPVNTGHLLSRADPFHMICVDINVWEELIQDASCRFHHSVCHLW